MKAVDNLKFKDRKRAFDFRLPNYFLHDSMKLKDGRFEIAKLSGTEAFKEQHDKGSVFIGLKMAGGNTEAAARFLHSGQEKTITKEEKADRKGNKVVKTKAAVLNLFLSRVS